MASTYNKTTDYHAARARTAHPVHGILSAFPVALFPAALVADIAYANSANMQWANFAVWLIAGGCAMGVIAALVWIGDALLFRRHRPRRAGGGAGGIVHGLATLLMLALGIVNGFIHSRDAWTSVVPTGLVLSVIVSILALAAGWQGYTLMAREAR